MTVANRLDFLMKKEGVKAYTLAIKTGVNQPTITRILSGESKQPKIANIEPLAKYFNVTTEWLLFGGTDIAVDNATLEPMQPKIPPPIIPARAMRAFFRP